jgi:hypothetical protein
MVKVGEGMIINGQWKKRYQVLRRPEMSSDG